MRTVADRHPGVTLALVGDGQLDAALREQCAQLGLTDNIRFLGFRSDIGRLLSGFDIFVMSSRTEALGTSVLDAMVMGLPVVSTSAGGIPEMVEPGVNGLLSAPRDADGLARNILTLIGDPVKRESMGAAGRETVKRFDVRVTAEKVEEVYNGLLGLRNDTGCIDR
jgi:glycosyltransferase involved in cell wall biosynthesis